jgi:hypothetical protein
MISDGLNCECITFEDRLSDIIEEPRVADRIIARFNELIVAAYDNGYKDGRADGAYDEAGDYDSHSLIGDRNY